MRGFVDITTEQCRIAIIVRFSRPALIFFPRVKLTATLFFSLLALCFSPALKAQSEPAATDPQVQNFYGEAKAAEASGDLIHAAASYESLLQIAPRLGPAYNNLGALYLKQHEYRKAAAILERGLKIDPKMSSASALLGIARYEIGDYAGARAPLETALRANPKDDNAELFLANDLIKLGELNRAAEHLRKLSERQPANQQVWYLLGKVHMKLSEQALSKLNEIDANSVWAHEISGEIMEGMKNYDGALIEYKKAVEMAPQQSGTHYLLGKTQEAQAEMKLFSKLEEKERAAKAERAKQVLEEKSKEQP